MNRVRHSDVTKALAEFNRISGLAYPAIGYVYYADVAGMSNVYRPKCYRITNEHGGVSLAYDLQGSTIRKTLANIENERMKL
jgi:hypothetical protein